MHHLLDVSPCNLAENLVGKVKNKKRRSGVAASPSAKTADIDTLFGAFMLRTPGFEAGMKACALYRVWLTTSGVHPADAFETKGIQRWLKKQHSR